MGKPLKKPLHKADVRDAPFYRFGQGFWTIDDKKKSEDLGIFVRIFSKWYSTESEAKAAYPKKFIEEMDKAKAKNLLLKSFNPTWNSFEDDFLKDRLDYVRGSTIYSKDRPFIRKFFDPLYSSMKVRDIFTIQKAESLMIKVSESKTKFGDPMSKIDKNRVVNLYRLMLEFAFEKRIISKEDHDGCYATVHPFKKRDDFVSSKKRESFSMTNDEVEKLLNVIPKWSEDYLLTSFLIGTGFRIGEALGILVKNIDFDKETIHKEAIWGVDDNGHYRRLIRTKNGCEGIYAISTKVIQSIACFVATNNLKPDDFLFQSKTNKGKACDPSAYRIRLRKYCSLAGIKNIWPHIGRHTFCTNVSKVTGQTNEDIKAIEALTGHSYKVDQSVYNHPSLEKMKSIIDKA